LELSTAFAIARRIPLSREAAGCPVDVGIWRAGEQARRSPTPRPAGAEPRQTSREPPAPRLVGRPDRWETPIGYFSYPIGSKRTGRGSQRAPSKYALPRSSFLSARAKGRPWVAIFTTGFAYAGDAPQGRAHVCRDQRRIGQPGPRLRPPPRRHPRRV
jgi:hypothetical protein